MNRNTLLLFLKSVLALFILFVSINSFANTFIAINSNRDFNDLTNWKDGFGTNPTIAEMTGGFDNFTIDGGQVITISSNVIVETLTITSGSSLKVIATNNITITVKGNLNINDFGGSTASTIDFGTGNVLLTVKGNLAGAAFSEIIHNPNAGKTQILNLSGTSNNVYTFIAGGNGTSLVRYDGGDQSIFNSDHYNDLELTGSGTKKLNGPSIIGAEATVNNKLTISNCKLELGAENFNYFGLETNLKCINGWIYTNIDGGKYSSMSSDNARTFPVGDAIKLRAIQLTNIQGKKISVSFIVNGAVPNGGFGSWNFIAPGSMQTQITFLNPGSTSISASSNIAVSSANSAWQIKPTTYNAGSYISTTNTSLSNIETSFSIFTCPALTLTPSSPPSATISDLYNQSFTVNDNGGSPYAIQSQSSIPAVYMVSAQSNIIQISGSPKTTAPVSLSFTVKNVNGCQTPFSYTINAVDVTTTWNGSSWSNGKPAIGKYAIIAAPYVTGLHEDISASKITILANQTLTISISGKIAATDSIKNYGTIISMCGSDMNGNFDGNPPISQSLIISPANPPTGMTTQPYSQTFTVAGDASPDFSIANINIPATDYTFTNNTLSFTQNTPKVINFDITYTNGSCVVTENKQIKIIDPPSPNLTIFNIGAKTYGDAPFKVHTYSRSTGTITYQITTPNPCASIDADGIVTMTCGGPSPQNIIVVKVSQAATPAGAANPYKAATATETFVIKPAAGRFIVRNFAYLVGQSKAITVVNKLNPPPTLTFQQLTGDANATVQADGTVDPIQVGDFSVRISMAATDNYTAFDSTYTFTVRTLEKPPVAVADTMVLEMGKDSTFNILDNDLGMTSEIAPNKTDIDIENDGVQIKFYATELGNFLIDQEGNLTIIPFNGFIGRGRLAYSIADINGLRSEIAYVEVIVNAPYVVPELKVNTTMTPNGDHLNDALVIANTDLAQENSLIIMDEAGNTVYETRNYQNNWEGVDHKNNTLEPGTYFYIFKEKSSGRELKNYIQIVK